MTKNTTQQAKQLVGTFNAYSQDRYSEAGWVQIARRLLTEGASEAEVRWIMESKYMRWAADAANRRHSATAAEFASYVVRTFKVTLPWQALIAKARKETAPTPVSHDGAYLACACTGDDIAAMIDLLRKVANDEISLGDTVLTAQQILARIEACAERGL